MAKHIVLAYSGGLDTSVGIHWLKKHFGAKVSAVLVDMGQDPAAIEAAVERAYANGAQNVLVPHVKDDFAENYVGPAIQANALYEGVYPLATALARPLIAKEVVQAAREVGGDAVAHGCTGKGNDQVRIETGVKALAPGMPCIAPQRSHPMTRDEVLRYAARHKLSLPPEKKSPYSVDENLWGRSVEGHDLEDPAHPINEAAFSWTASPEKAPAAGATFTVAFEHGLPVALDGQKMKPAALIAKLNTLAGANGVGRIDHVENRLVGIKSREVYEAPAAVAVLAAKRALEALTLTKDEVRLKAVLEQRFSEAVYEGLWYAPVMKAVRAFVTEVQSNVRGEVTLKAQKGALTVLGRTSPISLYDTALATYADGDAFHHQAAEGFIELWSLPLETAAKARGNPAAPAKAGGKAKSTASKKAVQVAP